jgi:hypothetical protein
MVTGSLGVAASSLNLLPPLSNGLLLGSSIGLVIASAIGPRIVTIREQVRNSKNRLSYTFPYEAEFEDRVAAIGRATKAANKADTAKQKEVTKTFDRLVQQLEDIDDPVVTGIVVKNFWRHVERFTAIYPEWHPEGRVRTFFLMKKIGKVLDLYNADRYLGMALGLLRARRDEARVMSRTTINGRVEKLYFDPLSEGTRYLAGTLLLMNRGEVDFAKGIVADAIHLWSDMRFDNLKEDFALVSMLEREERKSLVDLLEREIVKSNLARDTKAALRAKEMYSTILNSRQRESGVP